MIINLRYPSALETSGMLLRAMALGRPAIVFDYDSFSDYPDAAVFKLPLNTFDTRELEEAIVNLAENPRRREQIGRAAAQFVHEQHAIEDCAREYADFIRSVIQNPSRRAALCAPALST
jgi:glycosyltransferase involved in cell wall biosynthesis